jgi:hypothetical protein
MQEIDSCSKYEEAAERKEQDDANCAFPRAGKPECQSEQAQRDYPDNQRESEFAARIPLDDTLTHCGNRRCDGDACRFMAPKSVVEHQIPDDGCSNRQET